MTVEEAQLGKVTAAFRRAAVMTAHNVSPRLLNELRWLRGRKNHLIFRLVDEKVNPGDTVLDIGASTGLFTARLLRLVGDSGCVHAFEPNPDSFSDLKRIKSRNLHLHNAALSDKREEVSLRVPVLDGRKEPGLGSIASSSVGGQASSVLEYEVSAAPLTSFLSESQPVHFIKCDVEGNEDAVLQGASHAIETFRPRILIELEERHRNKPISVTMERLRDLGYRGWALFPEKLKPLDDFDVERDQVSVARSVSNSQSAEMPANYIHNFFFEHDGRNR